jgi:tetratricopeptide (TPR) repeat protein
VIYTNSKILSDKANLIYKNNTNSALFVRTAQYQLENNNIDAAIEILNKGLKIYPDHPVAYLLLGKAYIMLGNYNLAEEFIRKGSSLIQCRDTYDYYLGEAAKTRDQRSMFNLTRDKLFAKPVAENDSMEQRKAVLEDHQPKDSKELQNRIDDRFERLVSTVSKVKALDKKDSEGTETNKNNPETTLLVSETLAEIYCTQGDFNEAINVYEKLIKRDPGKKDYYSKKIEEIRKSLNSK